MRPIKIGHGLFSVFKVNILKTNHGYTTMVELQLSICPLVFKNYQWVFSERMTQNIPNQCIYTCIGRKYPHWSDQRVLVCICLWSLNQNQQTLFVYPRYSLSLQILSQWLNPSLTQSTLSSRKQQPYLQDLIHSKTIQRSVYHCCFIDHCLIDIFVCFSIIKQTKHLHSLYGGCE